MKQTVLAALFVVLVAAVLIACAPAPSPASKKTRRDELAAAGLLGEHELRHAPERITGIQGNFSGAFFLLGGYTSGAVSAQDSLDFSWGRSRSEIFSTTLPRSYFHVNIDESKQVPTVEFIFDSRWLGMVSSENFAGDSWYTPDDLRNLSVFFDQAAVVKQGYLKSVEVRISTDGLANEPALPH